jgi:hypothetical protein
MTGFGPGSARCRIGDCSGDKFDTPQGVKQIGDILSDKNTEASGIGSMAC